MSTTSQPGPVSIPAPRTPQRNGQRSDFELYSWLFMRLSGVAKRQGGYVARIDYGCANPGSGIPTNRSATQGCVVAHDGDVNYNALRVALRLVASDDLEFNVTADLTEDHRNPPPGVLLVAEEAFVPVTIVPSREVLSQTGSNLADALQNKPGITGSSFAAGASRPIITPASR